MARYPSSWPWFEQPAPPRRRTLRPTPQGWHTRPRPLDPYRMTPRRPAAADPTSPSPQPRRVDPVHTTEYVDTPPQSPSVEPAVTDPAPSPEPAAEPAAPTQASASARVCDDVSGGSWTWKARFQRLQADFDNYRRRQREDAEVERQRARAAVIKPWLEVLDSVDRALDTDAEGDDNPWRDGLLAIQRQMQQLLSREGVTAMASDGVSFDPHRFEAIATVPAANDEASGVVKHTTQTGYEFADGAVLRPAQVVVTAS